MMFATPLGAVPASAAGAEPADRGDLIAERTGRAGHVRGSEGLRVAFEARRRVVGGLLEATDADQLVRQHVFVQGVTERQGIGEEIDERGGVVDRHRCGDGAHVGPGVAQRGDEDAAGLAGLPGSERETGVVPR